MFEFIKQISDVNNWKLIESIHMIYTGALSFAVFLLRKKMLLFQSLQNTPDLDCYFTIDNSTNQIQLTINNNGSYKISNLKIANLSFYQFRKKILKKNYCLSSDPINANAQKVFIVPRNVIRGTLAMRPLQKYYYPFRLFYSSHVKKRNRLFINP